MRPMHVGVPIPSDQFVYKRAAQFKHPSQVQNAVPGDFTQDGRLDLLVMSDGGTDQISMSLYVAESKGGLSTLPASGMLATS
jgi:integrin alpha FG-GAP repeat containing protein 1